MGETESHVPEGAIDFKAPITGETVSPDVVENFSTLEAEADIPQAKEEAAAQRTYPSEITLPEAKIPSEVHTANIDSVKDQPETTRPETSSLAEVSQEKTDPDTVPVEGLKPGDAFARKVHEHAVEENKIGQGAQKKVYSYPDDPQKVMSVFKEDIDTSTDPPAQQRYYTQKILHLLFPNNIPDIYLAASNPNMLVLERVEPIKESFLQKALHSVTNPIARKLFERKLDKATGLGLDNSHGFNFIHSKSGSFMYVDDVIGRLADEYSKERVSKAINQNLRGEEKERALAYLGRLESYEEGRVSELEKIWAREGISTEK